MTKRLKGLEPSTFCMASRRSSQLSYSRARRQYIPGFSADAQAELGAAATGDATASEPVAIRPARSRSAIAHVA